MVSNSCLSGRIYKTLNRQYNTPFIGLFIPPPCFAKLVTDFEHYMAKDLVFTKESTYPHHPNSRRTNTPCPIGLLGDVELQFIHYSSEEEAAQKWYKRKARMDHTKLYYILAINGACDTAIISQYTELEPHNKVCFHHQKELEMCSCIYIPSNHEHIGNLYSQYHRFVGRFDFTDWILSNRKTRKSSSCRKLPAP